MESAVHVVNRKSRTARSAKLPVRATLMPRMISDTVSVPAETKNASRTRLTSVAGRTRPIKQKRSDCLYECGREYRAENRETRHKRKRNNKDARGE